MTMKFFTASLALTFLVACGSRTSDEEQVRALLETAESAAEARDASDVLAVIATDYSDSQGFDRTQLQNFLRAYFLANPRVEILMTVQELEFPVAGLARARVGLTSLPAGDRATLRVEFRKERGDWRVARADRVRD
jgi:hypothetical protein